METVLTSKGQLVIPKSIRDTEHLEPGTRFSISVEADHSIRLQKIDSGYLNSLVGSIKKGALENLVQEREKERKNDRI